MPSDEYFVKMMESTWQCPENDNDPVGKASVQMLLKEVRLRILELAKNDPKILKKIFSDFDLNQSGHITIDEATNMIAKLKISVERKYVYPFFKIVDKDNSGGIEYNEFEGYVLGK
jgi:Ca2+-binding EF-hand superfamily protein